MDDDLDLDGAYGLKTAEDSRRLYGKWADSYDETFAEAMDYQSPKRIAEAYVAAGGQGNVLDVGAGTGLVGAALRDLGIAPVHALDLSPEMIEVARNKDIYAEFHVGDVTKPLEIEPESFDGIVSAGTFTNGHVGPDGLDALMTVAKHGCLFALTIHSRHFEAAGFATRLEALRGEIKGLILPEIRAYGDGAEGEHKDDTVYIAQFVKV